MSEQSLQGEEELGAEAWREVFLSSRGLGRASCRSYEFSWALKQRGR